MKIILDEAESAEWLTRRHPCKCSHEEMKSVPFSARRPAFDEPTKARIMGLADSGLSGKLIAKELGLYQKQVENSIWRHRHAKKDADQKQSLEKRVDEIIRENQEECMRETPMINGVFGGSLFTCLLCGQNYSGKHICPEVKDEATEDLSARCTKCYDLLGNDRVAIGGKIYCSPACAPSKVPLMVTKRSAKKSQIDEELLELVADHAGESAQSLAAYLSSNHGYVGITPGKVVCLRRILTRRQNAPGSHVEPKDESKVSNVVEPPIVPEVANKKPTRSIDEMAIDHIINMGINSGYKYSAIAAKIGREVGGTWTADNVAARIKELRGDKP